PGEPTEPNTSPTNPGEPTEPNTSPTNPGESTEPNTSPTNPGEPTEPSTPPTNPTIPQEQLANIKEIVDNPIPNNPEDIKKQIEELKEFIEIFGKLTPEEQAELLHILGVEFAKLKERLAELERTLVVVDSKEPTTNDKAAVDNNVLTAGENIAKLPQTNGASTTAMLYVGLALMAMSVFFFIRRRKNA
ncbi:MAG: LPXTG cell wall anchor domain-containing protein, partial [Lysinibacillus sp.]